MSNAIVSLQCYEPAGASIDFSCEDLCGHTLIIGGTGSGKTTRIVYPMLEQLIRQSVVPIGLCVYDTKADGAMRAILERACREAGRSEYLVVIDESSHAYPDCFTMQKNQDITAIDALAGLIGSSIPADERNHYWDVTFLGLLRQALRLYAFDSEAESTYAGMVRYLMRYLLLHQIRDPYFTALVEELKADREVKSDSEQSTLDEVIATHAMWDTLDYRTRTNLQSMSSSVIGPMNSPVAHRFFSGSTPVSIAETINAGKILLVSIDAMRHPECARQIGCLLKGIFYDTVLKSPANCPTMKGLILDDWPVSVTAGVGNRYSDVESLSMVRSRGGFVVAATQSLAALDVSIGRPSRSAALANFANLVFCRCRDPEVDALAALYMGERKDRLIDVSITEKPTNSNRSYPPVRIEREIKVPAVPPGALARLATGDAYALVGSSVYSNPLCLVPTYHNPQHSNDNEPTHE